MKILVLSFYYKPDLCAGSFRCSALVKQLDVKENLEVDVITTQPNRYSSFSMQAPEFESNGKIKIYRIDLIPHKNGIIDQMRSFVGFYIEAIRISRSEKYDLVFATSSRLFTAFLGARISSINKAPLYLDIRDIFVDTIDNVMSSKINWLVKPVVSLIEAYTFRKAKRINLVSEGFKEYFVKRYPRSEYSWFTNGIDNDFLSFLPGCEKTYDRSSYITVLYAGNIGEGQGLHHILPKLARRLGGAVKFKIIGDGGRKKLLKESICGIENIELLSPVNRHDLIKEYSNADVLFLHLNDYPAFRKVLPSKIFEYAALGKPILAGVSGYAAEFLQKEVVGCSIFSPCDDEGAYDAFVNLSLKLTPRNEFVEKFSRDKIMARMAGDIVSCINYDC